MIKLTLPNYPLFQEIIQKLKTEEIYFQIENQDCYLVRSGTEQLQKIKIAGRSPWLNTITALAVGNEWAENLDLNFDKNPEFAKNVKGGNYNEQQNRKTTQFHLLSLFCYFPTPRNSRKGKPKL
ncbi:2576_t:CDS:2 [Entrophospora sp. SA101]|nr:2576_t:CDS:2 [Entrophospora sp. SA101]